MQWLIIHYLVPRTSPMFSYMLVIPKFAPSFFSTILKYSQEIHIEIIGTTYSPYAKLDEELFTSFSLSRSLIDIDFT